MDITVLDVALVPVIIGLVEVFKKLGLSNKFTPLFSVVLGIVFGVFYVRTGEIATDVLVGIALGLSASGLYSTSKTMIE